MESNHLRNYNFKISYGPSDDRLHDFYIPALSRSVRYDRSAGFFSSTALAVAAAGVARLIQNGGTMRLLVGAQLSEEDVEAIRKGDELRERLSAQLLDAILDPEDVLLRRRLEVLAWMVAEGTLEIKVALPKGDDGAPLPASVAADYYHPKEGVFTDANGDQIAFSGSVNESATGWIHNYEQFMVYRSWDASFPFLSEVVNRFERLWSGEEPSWVAVSIPEAVKARLLKFHPKQAPTVDPLERTDEEEVLQRERILFQFVRDAPFLPNANGLGMATSTVTPWPHQQKVADDIVERFPERFLLCDEVGLGKTIEAGLVIRQLIISGKVNRCLILTPKSILKQWQEELYEKFVINVPRYDSGRFIDVFERELEQSRKVGNAHPTNPFNSFPFILASSQLVKRKERQPQLLQAEPWDLIVVDEAHHARRKDFLDERY
ncbi:MAG: DEAD/DEAH box helicase family protein, partial [Candidatus Poribacteria bacterium]